jgi:hypothetical protein
MLVFRMEKGGKAARQIRIDKHHPIAETAFQVRNR